jgi:hypothetical protein
MLLWVRLSRSQTSLPPPSGILPELAAAGIALDIKATIAWADE